LIPDLAPGKRRKRQVDRQDDVIDVALLKQLIDWNLQMTSSRQKV
jgi:hypothetical protein